MKGVIAALLLSLTVFAGDALAQKALKEQVVGTWIHVSTTVTSPDGKKSDRPGKGVLIYAPDGYFAFVNVAENLPRLASGNRARTTPEEAQAIVTNSLAYYGTYKVDETTKTIVPTVEGSTFPNMVGTDQSRVVRCQVPVDEMISSSIQRRQSVGPEIVLWPAVTRACALRLQHGACVRAGG